MKYYDDINSGILVGMSFMFGWLIAQLLKTLIYIVKHRENLKADKIFYYMVKSGGMPSGHTASFSAASIAMGLIYGFLSPMFAISACITSIIIYDAVNVRYSVGVQGKTLNKIIAGNSGLGIRKIKVVEGHTIPQIIVGLMVGIISAELAFLIWNMSNHFM